MSIASEFESTIENVQNAYQGLANLGATIPQNKTIENISDCLDEVYDVLPKTEFQEGTEVTIEGGLKGKLDFDEGKVGFGQASQESTQGYNLLPKNAPTTLSANGLTCTIKEDGRIILNGTTTALTTFYILGNGDVTQTRLTLPAGTYTGTLGKDVVANNRLMVNIMKTNNTQVFPSQLRWVTYETVTLNEETYVGNMNITALSDTTFNNYELDIMILSGTYTSSNMPNFEPYTGGYASPSPNWEQEVKCVAGRNKVPLNEADFTTTFYGQNVEIKDEVIKISGSPTQIYSISIGKNGLVIPSDTSRITFKVNRGTYKYTQFNSGTSYSGINVRLKDEDTDTLYTTGSTITLSETHTFSINIYVNETSSKNAEIKIQLEKGSQATSYLPYNTLEVVERGKNLVSLGESTWTKAGLTGSYDNSKIIVNGTTTGGTNVLEPNYKSLGTFKKGTYVFSTNVLNGSVITNGGATAIYIRNSNDTTHDTLNISGGFNNVNLKDKTFTLTQDTELFLQIYANASNIVYTNYEVGIQIENDTTSTTYEPYQTPQTYQLSLGEYEFAKTGNYVDTIEYDVDEDKVYKNKNIDKTLLSTLTWENATVGTNTYGTRNLINTIGKVVTDINIICSHAVGIIFNDRNWFTNTTIYAETNGYVNFRNTAFTSLEEFITFLSNNNVYAYYVLATPTKEEITGTLKDQIKALYYSHSFNGTTIIEIDGQLPLIIKVRALKGE